MIIDKYLKTLALANRRIIIPNLGAFLSKEGDGDGKNLIFSSFLKYNDGFLESYIAEKEKVSVTESADLVRQFVDEVGKTIRSGRRYEVDNFGYFYMDDRGGVAFMSKGAEAENVGTVVTPAAPAEPVYVAPVVEQTPVTPAAPTVVVVEPVVVQPATAPTPPPPSRPAEPKKEAVPYEPEQKKGVNGLLITILILLIIILLLIASYFLFPAVKEKVNSLFGRTTVTTVTDTDTTAIHTKDTLDINQVGSSENGQTGTGTSNTNTATTTGTGTTATSTPTPKVVDVTATASMEANAYYVIVGTFKEKANADKMLQQCTGDGYKAELLPKMGVLYPVSIYKSTNKAEAYDKWLEARRKYGDSWIFRSRR